MEGRRRTIEIDEALAVALEERAADRGQSLDEFLTEGLADSAVINLHPEDLVELEARSAEWERDHLGASAEDVFERLRTRAEGREPSPPLYRRY